MTNPYGTALELQMFETHRVQVDTPFGQYQGLLSNFDGRLCWLADSEAPVGRPPVAYIKLGDQWAVRHVHEGCPACEADDETEDEDEG